MTLKVLISLPKLLVPPIQESFEKGNFFREEKYTLCRCHCDKGSPCHIKFHESSNPFTLNLDETREREGGREGECGMRWLVLMKKSSFQI